MIFSSPRWRTSETEGRRTCRPSPSVPPALQCAMRKFLCLAIAALVAGAASANVYRTDAEALKETFRDAEAVEERKLVLSREERAAIEKTLGCKLSDVVMGAAGSFTFHVGMRGEKIYPL